MLKHRDDNELIPLIFGVSANQTICQNKLDFGFMLDSSGSVGKKSFERMKSFVKSLTDYYEVGLDETRVSVMSFSTEAIIEILFFHSWNKKWFDLAVDRIKYQGYRSYTGEALEKAYSVMFTSGYGARGTGRDLIVDSNISILTLGNYRQTVYRQ